MNSKIKLYQELDKTLSNIKLIEMKIKTVLTFYNRFLSKHKITKIEKINYRNNLDFFVYQYHLQNT